MKLTEERWFRAAILIAIAAGVLAVAALASNDAGGTPATSPTDAQVQPGDPIDAGLEPSTTTDVQDDPAEPVEPSPEQRTCLDGSVAENGENCGGLLSNATMFAVAGVTEDQCTEDTEYPWNAPGQSFMCTVETGELHVARYRNASTKAQRLAFYGRCAHNDDWQVCGPKNHQWVRTYWADDLLMYTSSRDKGVLLSLDGVSEDTVRHGR